MRALLHSLILCVAASSLASGHAPTAKIVSSPVHFGGLRGYYTNVSIGTPPQPFRVALGIVSASLWVADSSCVPPPPSTINPGLCPAYCRDAVYCHLPLLCPSPCDCPSVALEEPSLIAKNDWGYCVYASKFRSNASSTYKKDGRYFYDDSNVMADYDLADEGAKGFVGIDSVSLGAAGSQVTVASNGFGQANMSTLDYDTFDGVFGLGPAKEALPGTQSIVANAFAKGVIDQPLITVALWNYLVSDKTPVYDAGTITFGGLDDKNCGHVKKYHPVVGKTGYNVNLDGMRIGSAKAPLLQGATAKFVSGSAYLLAGGYGLIDPIAMATGATFTSGSYLIDCNATFPSLFLTLDGTDYEFPAKTVIMKSEYDGGCYLPFDVVDKQEDRTAIYIGEPVHKAFCLVLDPVHDRIGFAPAKPRK